MQCGVAEMKDCVEKTGGAIVQTDTFSNIIFKVLPSKSL